MGRKRSWTDEQFIAAVRTSVSIREVLEKLGLRPVGGNYRELRRHARRLLVTTTHFVGRGHLRGKTHDWRPKRPLEQVLVEHSSYTNMAWLKKRLIAEGAIEPRCSCCQLTDWLGAPISLELDHVNGVHDDHRRENLPFLCPNCHAQTGTYRGRNKGTYANGSGLVTSAVPQRAAGRDGALPPPTGGARISRL
jgi:hypothetical protein